MEDLFWILMDFQLCWRILQLVFVTEMRQLSITCWNDFFTLRSVTFCSAQSNNCYQTLEKWRKANNCTSYYMVLILTLMLLTVETYHWHLPYRNFSWQPIVFDHTQLRISHPSTMLAAFLSEYNFKLFQIISNIFIFIFSDKIHLFIQ